MLVLSRHNSKKNNTHLLSQGVKLATMTGIIVAGVENMSKITNKKTTSMTSTDYLNGIAVGGLVGASLYGVLSLFIPMWREVTEYRPDESPFLKISNYFDFQHRPIKKDLYS